jgi:hypothetical protein
MEITKPAMASALQGIKRGLDGLDKNAAELASKAQMEGEASPEGPLVEAKMNRLQVEANAKMVQTVDEVLGRLIDELA